MNFGRQLDFLKRLLNPPPAAEIPAAGTPILAPAPKAKKAPSGQDGALEERCRELLRGLHCEALGARVSVRWNPRMRSTAGMAYAGRSLITLNPRLREFGDEEVTRTLLHELAHLLAHHRAGRRRIPPHGEEWRKACRDLGLRDEKRCHTLPLPRREMARRHFYRCPKCAIEVQRVRPFRRKIACLACCRRYNSGQYDDRFKLLKIASPQ